MTRPLKPIASVAVALLAALMIACGGSGDDGTTSPVTPTAGATDSIATATDAPTLEPGVRLTTVEIVRKLRPSVVQVLTEDAGLNVFGQIVPSRGIGTGIILDVEGHILTNNHVIRVNGDPTGPISRNITVTLFDGSTARADVVGTDRDTDLAVLQIDTEGLSPADLGDAASLLVGADVVAMGFALGLEGAPTVTRGVVSAKDRTIQQQTISINGLIQTDASINPGNSGGPLVDDRGRVVGINTAIIRGGEHIGFSISIDLAKPIIQELIQSGRVERGFLGVGIIDVTPGLARSLGLPAEEGVSINNIVPGSPADEAGLETEDIIIGIADDDVRNSGDLLESLRRHREGEQVVIHFYRDGDEQEAEVTLGAQPN